MIPAPSAKGSPNGTTRPRSPTIRELSPTFVTTQGHPQAIASAIAKYLQ